MVRSVQSGQSGVIVTVLVDRTGKVARPSTRLFVSDQGELVGHVHPDIDAELVREAREIVAGKRSLMRSYRIHDGRLDAVGVRGGEIDIFFEVLERRPRLIVVGAGHIAMPLVRVGKLLDFEVIVLDDRPEYANRGRFPDADEVLTGPYRETLASISIQSDTYIVLVTRGHVHDQACLEAVLDSDAAYIGMIGSKRRVRTTLQHLEDAGRDAGQLDRINAPIGLDIGARTPAEIAVAVAAEIVTVRRGGQARSLTLARKLHV